MGTVVAGFQGQPFYVEVTYWAVTGSFILSRFAACMITANVLCSGDSRNIEVEVCLSLVKEHLAKSG